MVRAPMLGLHTGRHRGDRRVLPGSACDGRAIRLRQGKGKDVGRAHVSVPATRALKAALKEAPHGVTILLAPV